MIINAIVQLATPLGVGVGVVGLFHGARVHKNQMNAQLFVEYTKRYETIMASFPSNALNVRMDMHGELPPQSAELTLALLQYLNLTSEEFYLHEQKYLSKNIWSIWESELKRTLRSQLVRREWISLKKEFESYPKFIEYVEDTMR